MPRTKWHSSGRSIVVGDIVLIRDSNPVKGCWSWGEVVEANPSHDGDIVRRATVRYKTSSSPLPGTKNSTKSKKNPSRFVEKSVRDLCLIMKAEDRNGS